MPHKNRVIRKKYQKQWYQTHKQETMEINRGKRAWIKFVLDFIRDFPCQDCGRKFPPECMDFDHLENKQFIISHEIRRRGSVDAVIEELMKCDLICSNCHRIRTQWRKRHACNRTTSSSTKN